MADGETYLIGLNDQVSGPAEKAAAATRALTSQLTTVKGALESLDKQKTLAAAYGDIGKYQAIEAKMVSLGAETERLKGELAGLPRVVEPATASLGKAGAGEGLAGTMEGLGEAASVAVAAIVAVGAAIGVVGGWAGKLALDASDFKGDTIDALSLVLETKDAAATTYDRLEDIANHTTMTNEAVQKRAFDLLAAGVHDGEQLDATIQSIADLVAVKGEQAAGKLDKIIERATTSGGFQVSAKMLQGTGVQMSDLLRNIADRTGQGVEEVAAQLKAGKVDVDIGIDAINAAIESKLGGFAAKQLNDLDVQFKRFKDNGKALFADIQTDKFLEGLASITSMLDRSTVSGQALKEIVDRVFQPMFDEATKLFPYIKVGFEEAIIVALELYIAIRPVREEFSRWLGTRTDVDSYEQSMLSVGHAVRAVADATVPLLQALLKIYEIGHDLDHIVADGLVGALRAVGVGSEDVAPKMRETGRDAGKEFAAGMSAGILGGAPEAHGAAQALADGAKDRVVKSLDIHSPSRVMMDMGADTAEGFELGLRGGTGDAHEAIGSLAAPPAPARPGASSGGGNKVDVGGVHVHISESAAAAGPSAIGDELAVKLAAFFEQLQLQAGA